MPSNKREHQDLRSRRARQPISWVDYSRMGAVVEARSGNANGKYDNESDPLLQHDLYHIGSSWTTFHQRPTHSSLRRVWVERCNETPSQPRSPASDQTPEDMTVATTDFPTMRRLAAIRSLDCCSLGTSPYAAQLVRCEV